MNEKLGDSYEMSCDLLDELNEAHSMLQQSMKDEGQCMKRFAVAFYEVRFMLCKNLECILCQLD